jgi:hypothetical protein
MSKANQLAYWIVQREAMRVDVTSVTDPYMRNVRYTNVRREDDKVTKWLAQNWRDQNMGHPNHTVGMVLARMVNYIPSLTVIGYPYTWRPNYIRNTLHGLKNAGLKIWSSAYTISTCGRAMDKTDYVVGHVCQQVAQAGPLLLAWSKTLEDALRALMTVDGLGSFLAAQVIADLKNTPGHPLASAPDWMTWSAYGPGSLKGLSYYFGRIITPATYQQAITDAWSEVCPLLPVELQNLHMQDLQSCFCEFSKFCRVQEGGHVRNKYPTKEK